MSMAAKKDLTLSKVKATAKKIDKMEKYEIEEGEYAGATISFYPIFSETKIEEVLLEFQSLQKEALDKKLELSEEMNVHLLQFLTIKHFTHFKKDMPSTLLGQGKNAAGLLDWMESFRSTGLYNLILTEVFLQSELKKVFDALSDFLGATLLLHDIEKSVQLKSARLKDKYSKEIDAVNKPLQ